MIFKEWLCFLPNIDCMKTKKKTMVCWCFCRFDLIWISFLLDTTQPFTIYRIFSDWTILIYQNPTSTPWSLNCPCVHENGRLKHCRHQRKQNRHRCNGEQSGRRSLRNVVGRVDQNIAIVRIAGETLRRISAQAAMIWAATTHYQAIWDAREATGVGSTANSAIGGELCSGARR